MDKIIGTHWQHGHIDEDSLTAFVFRTFSYIPEAFAKFWQELAAQKRPGFPAEPRNVEFRPWPGWQVPEDYKTTLGKLRRKAKVLSINTQEANKSAVKQKEGIEPDIVIETDDCILIVESKLSKSFEPDQLIEQFIAAQKYYCKKKKAVFQLLLNKTLCRPGDLDGEIKDLCCDPAIFCDEKCPSPDFDMLLSNLLWYNWQSIVRLFWNVWNQLQNSPIAAVKAKILADTVETILMVNKRELEPVESPVSEVQELILHGAKDKFDRLTEFIDEAITIERDLLLNILRNRTQVDNLMQWLCK